MPWCKHCAKDCAAERDFDNGYVCCADCGRVIDQDIYATDVTFIKTAGGQSQLSGSFVRSVQSDYSASHERTLLKGRDEISDMVVSLCVSGGDSIINQAHAFYTIAVERNFTRGRRTAQVAAACLYIACRQNSKAYLLIDFSEHLQINVYVLGAVFLQLCKLLRLEEHPIVQKPIDPSLFIHRFTERLLGQKNFAVSKTAMRIIASMKRDWMQTGRKPSGLCGAALYISALSHGLKYSKSDIVSIVHICEATLTKRLIEFENTESGSLTIEEFITKANELEGETHSRQQPLVSKASGITEVLCEHKDHGALHFAHGLCKKCYVDFVELSGGLQGGSEPPAFLRAERQRLAKAVEEKNEKEVESSSFINSNATAKESDTNKESENIGIATRCEAVDEVASDKFSFQGTGNIEIDESETLSDIDDVEVDGYLHNEEEARYKKIIWEKMNKEYLEELAAKEAAAAAAKEAFEANFKNCTADMLSAKELLAATMEGVAKLRKEQRRKRAEDARNSTPAQTAAEATRQMLDKKRLSSKINYDVLEKLFDNSSDQEKIKQRRVESDSCHDVDGEGKIKEGDEAFHSETIDNEEYGPEGQFEEEYDGGPTEVDYPYYENQGEEYGYDEGYGYDD